MALWIFWTVCSMYFWRLERTAIITQVNFKCNNNRHSVYADDEWIANCLLYFMNVISCNFLSIHHASPCYLPILIHTNKSISLQISEFYGRKKKQMQQSVENRLVKKKLQWNKKKNSMQRDDVLFPTWS